MVWALMPEIPSPLIDVLSADSFARERLPGAVNLCVYETAFIDKVRERFPDKTTSLTVYGLSDATREAQTAREILQADGYRNIEILSGGLADWKAADKALEQTKTPDAPATGRFAIDTKASFIHWTGRNLFNYHSGGLQLGDGSIELDAGKLVAGRIDVDMTSLSCSDLTDSQLNQMLIGHLRSGDFFSVDQFPIATFAIASADPIDGATDGLPNYQVHGNFTLRGVTRPLALPAVIARQESGAFVAQAVISIDRTEWGSIYGSGKFFARLGQHVVNDLVHLHLKIVTTGA